MDTGLYMNPEYPVVLSRSPVSSVLFGDIGFCKD